MFRVEHSVELALQCAAMVPSDTAAAFLLVAGLPFASLCFADWYARHRVRYQYNLTVALAVSVFVQALIRWPALGVNLLIFLAGALGSMHAQWKQFKARKRERFNPWVMLFVGLVVWLVVHYLGKWAGVL
jgi:hypothetical protein